MKWFYLLGFLCTIFNAVVIGVDHGGPWLHWLGWALAALLLIPNMVRVWCEDDGA